MIEATLAGLVDALALRTVEDGTSGGGVLEGQNLDIGYHRIFGGQILGQLVVAASGAVPDKTVKSLHVLFPREGDADRPLHFRVTPHHVGRTFASLQVVVVQEPDERIVALATVSMHAADDGLVHAATPPSVGGPDDATEQQLDLIPWEVRVVDDVDLADRAVGPPRFDWWMRAPEAAGIPTGTADAPRVVPAGTAGAVAGVLDQALLAHATDLTVIGTALRPVDGLSQADSTVRIATAVTSHTLWFHRPFTITDWLQIHQDAPVLSGGRAFGRGDVFSGADLVASFAQESMIRLLDAG
jgi:acyl-CoA thioesterase-2